MVCGFLLPLFAARMIPVFSSKLQVCALINTTNIFSAEKHGIPERKPLEKRKRARYIITNGVPPVRDSPQNDVSLPSLPNNQR
jgi:hypothetical protein